MKSQNARKKKNAAIKSIIDAEGNRLDSKIDIANKLNQHFSSVGKIMASKLENSSEEIDPLDYITSRSTRTAFFEKIDSTEILDLIKNLETKKSAGYDSITNNVIKQTSFVIAPYLEKLFNRCLFKGIFPECFKIAQVTPLHKGGDKQDPNSYRPISLLPGFGKLLERVISSRLLGYLNKYNLLSSFQFGFRKGFNTEYAILDIYEKLLHNLDNRLSSCAIFLDLAKAFDSVSHNILLKKLDKYGIRGLPLDLLKSYLRDRSQFVKLDQYSSSSEIIEFGVPQGSILGPLLFLIYINDLPQATKFFIKLYADDTFLCYQHENIKELERDANIELKKVCDWLTANRLTLNVKKSKFMIITKKRVDTSNFSIRINNAELEVCDSYKYLGVYFDKNLNWKTHIEYISEKISKSRGILAKIRNCVETETIREIYHALVHSYLKYGILAWGTAPKTTLKPLQTLVNRAIKIISFAPFHNFDLNPLFEILEILNIEQIYTLEASKLAFRDRKNPLPTTIAKYFDYYSSDAPTNMRTRTRHPRPLVKFNTTTGAKTFQNISIKIWDDIPEEIKQTQWTNSFKKMFKSHLLLLNFN